MDYQQNETGTSVTDDKVGHFRERTDHAKERAGVDCELGGAEDRPSQPGVPPRP
jgi:hypothetical protein